MRSAVMQLLDTSGLDEPRSFSQRSVGQNNLGVVYYIQKLPQTALPSSKAIHMLHVKRSY